MVEAEAEATRAEESEEAEAPIWDRAEEMAPPAAEVSEPTAEAAEDRAEATAPAAEDASALALIPTSALDMRSQKIHSRSLDGGNGLGGRGRSGLDGITSGLGGTGNGLGGGGAVESGHSAVGAQTLSGVDGVGEVIALVVFTGYQQTAPCFDSEVGDKGVFSEVKQVSLKRPSRLLR